MTSVLKDSKRECMEVCMGLRLGGHHIIIIIIFIEDINFTDKWFTKESSKIKIEHKGKIRQIYK